MKNTTLLIISMYLLFTSCKTVKIIDKEQFDKITFKVQLKPDNILQFRTCQSQALIKTSNGANDTNYSELLPRVITTCQCKENNNPENIKNIYKENAISVLNFVLNDIENAEFGNGVMMLPKKPKYFSHHDRRQFLFIKRCSRYTQENSVYRGYNPWMELWDPTPMTKAFGRDTLDLQLVKRFYPVYWAKLNETSNSKDPKFKDIKNNNKDSCLYRLIIFKKVKRKLLSSLENERQKNEKSFSKEHIEKLIGTAKYAKLVQRGKILELYFVKENNVYHLRYMSHALIESASPASQTLYTDIRESIYVHDYPCKQPFIIDPEEKKKLVKGLKFEKPEKYIFSFVSLSGNLPKSKYNFEDIKVIGLDFAEKKVYKARISN